MLEPPGLAFTASHSFPWELRQRRKRKERNWRDSSRRSRKENLKHSFLLGSDLPMASADEIQSKETGSKDALLRSQLLEAQRAALKRWRT